MRIYEILKEEYRKDILTKSDDKNRFADDVWAMLNASYARLGGFKSFDNKTHMVNDPGMWILIFDENENLIAALVSKYQYGNKLVGMGTDGSQESKKQLIYLMQYLKRQQNFWTEASGPAEKFFNNLDIPKIESKHAEKLTGKQILDYDENGYHYTRFISGQPIRKIIMGYPEV